MRLVALFLLLFFEFELIAAPGGSGQVEKVKPYVTSFSNFRYDFDSQEFNFRQDKILLGIKYQINPQLLMTIGADLLELDHNNPTHRRPYLKPCNIQYSSHGWIAEVGIFYTSQYDYQRNSLWGFRYVFRTMQNHYAMGVNADLGFRVSRRINNWLSSDFSFTSGEGHKEPDLSDNSRYALRLFLKPLKRITLSAYGDMMDHFVTETTFAGTVDYRIDDKYSVSMEINKKRNFRFSEGHQLNGVSVYGNYKLSDHFRIFSRWDYLAGSAKESRAELWNQLSLGNRFINGVQYTVCKFCRIAIDYNDWSPLSQNVPGNSFVSFDVEIKY